MDSVKLYLWRYIRNEPKLTRIISGQSSHLVKPHVSAYSVPRETALFQSPSRALLEYVNYGFLTAFSLTFQLMSLIALIYLLKCLRFQIICPFPKVINMLLETSNVLFC